MMIGRRPYAAFGNSIGDWPMLGDTTAGVGARLGMLVLHDDGSASAAYWPAAWAAAWTPRQARSPRRFMATQRKTAGPSSA